MTLRKFFCIQVKRLFCTLEKCILKSKVIQNKCGYDCMACLSSYTLLHLLLADIILVVWKEILIHTIRYTTQRRDAP